MKFYNKIKWILGILIVFVLIITTNLVDKNNFTRVRDAVVTIYEDRLIAKDLIFEMLKAVHEKEVAVALSDSLFFLQENDKINNDVQSLISRYEQTKLTSEESSVFEDLKDNFQSLKIAEGSYIASYPKDENNLVEQISEVKENLSELSKIQLNEGRRQMSISKKALETVELFTHIEIYLLIFLAIIIQIIIMYNPKKK
ncbi:MCP four helix bundle domain-containing protein [Algibacter sp. 2305UL17-15]|uniref:MCP four helix bundle domain-containing protein n=1 Tax=Algibacter sp. 2305UL17-15 TaxID=3231268 RepID=UPI00345ACFFA